MVNKAMIMAAGVGSRLDPLTRNVPKPLIPIANIPTMDILLSQLSKNGIKKVIANTHYLAEQIQNRYSKNSPVDIDFQYIHEETLSGTAGGVKKCQFFFEENEDFIVMSADGLTDLDIKSAIEFHKDSNCIATMVTKKVKESEVEKFGVIVTDENGYIKEFQEKPKKEEAKSDLINTGIYIFNYKIFEYIPENTFYDFAKNVFPSLLKNKVKINTYCTDKYWSDIGSIEQYIDSTIDIINEKIALPNLNIKKVNNSSFVAGINVDISDSAIIEGICSIGDNSIIKDNSAIINSILWDNVEISENVTIENCIIAANSKIKISIKDKVIEANSDITNEDLLKK